MQNDAPPSPQPAPAPKRPRWELTALAFVAYLGGQHLHWSEGMLGFFRIFVVITGYQLVEDRLGLLWTQTKYPGRYLLRMVFFLLGTVLLWQGVEARSLGMAGAGGGLLLIYAWVLRGQLRLFKAGPSAA